MKTIRHDKETDTVWIQWGKLQKEHIGWTEEINLNGVMILVDRNKKGKVCAIEVL